MIVPKPDEQLNAMRDELWKFTIRQVDELGIENFSELIKRDGLYFL